MRASPLDLNAEAMAVDFKLKRYRFTRMMREMNPDKHLSSQSKYIYYSSLNFYTMPLSAQIRFSALTSFAMLLACMMVGGCAGQRPPGGGPVDTVPPEIVSVYPLPNTAHFNDKRFRLEFSKYVDRRSVEESIFISPPVGELDFDWSGTEVEASFQHPLKKNTTYVITIGTDVVDINNRNRMAKSFSLAFSTGENIDRGKIEGKVYDEKPEGIMIFAYRLDSLDRDTLNPMTLNPDYITQTGKSGTYSLPYLAFGTYRVFAVRDEYRNLLYDPEADEMSTATNDVGLNENDSIRSELDFQLSLEDTTAPRLVGASASDNRHVILTFSEEIDSTSMAGASFTVTDTGLTHRLLVQKVFLHRNKQSLITLLTEPQTKDSLYNIVVRGVKDLAGHFINERAESKSFTGAGTPDTTRPALIYYSLQDTGGGVPLDSSFRFDYDDALDTASVDQSVRLVTADSAEVPIIIRWKTPASFDVAPGQSLKPNAVYSIRVRLNTLKDYAGNHFSKDSSKIISFKTIDPEKLGSIEGMVNDPDTTLADRYIVVAQNVTTKGRTVEVSARRGKAFLLAMLTEGWYVVKAFQDRESTGMYFSGRPFPFLPSERFAVYADTVKVRARWPVDGLIIRMK